ncbi:hypothetical protein [Pararobbsia silviterrae]|uniref:Uncharacterized protein n=1 Tax=Pararobbsia silviterrae TaxID=1792498 RepID=A0A494X1Z6_9BURK|nr:hypothetical protein [Pararobbsia silviterrae]RKP44758.1 hypothetical protein D7S86_27455 [Pararobbsia silviterrae]
MSARIQIVVVDSKGNSFDPNSLAHVYTNDDDGNRLTDTCFDGAVTRVKTCTYDTSGAKLTESAWVVQ